MTLSGRRACRLPALRETDAVPARVSFVLTTHVCADMCMQTCDCDSAIECMQTCDSAVVTDGRPWLRSRLLLCWLEASVVTE